MAALQATSTDNRTKKVVRKRRSSEGDSGNEGNSSKTSKTDSDADAKSADGQAGSSSGKDGSDKVTSPPILSPTSIKPTLNFYKDTLTDSPSEDKKTDGKKDFSNGDQKDSNRELFPLDSVMKEEIEGDKLKEENMDIDDGDLNTGKLY